MVCLEELREERGPGLMCVFIVLKFLTVYLQL